MSPELNGNPPILPKRKKNRERKHASTSNIRQGQEFSVPQYYHFQPSLNSYCPYPTAPSFAIHPEPVSLPIFPRSYHYNSPPVYNNNNALGGNRLFKTQQKLFQNEECLSLPVVKDEIEIVDESGQRRYSDPGIPNESDTGSEPDGQMIQMLMHQVNVLQDNNRQLMREVTELRIEVNVLKQQHMHSNGFERDYEPGMISDFIKEIRDAARIREEALLAKVKHMVEEKQFSANQFQLASEKTRHNERIAKLEEQIKSMNVTNNLGGISNNSLRLEDNMSLPSMSLSLSDDNSVQTNRQVCELEREVLQLRREVQDFRSKKEESTNKILQLEKKLSQQYQQPSIQRRESTLSATEALNSDDKASLSSSSTTHDNLSMVTSTQSSIVSSSPQHHKFMQIGPVTDL